MGAEVVDTNVLVLASAVDAQWVRPRVPTDDRQVLERVYRWLKEFRNDSERALAMDFPEKTIFLEYRRNLDPGDYGRRVVQHKFDTGSLHPVDLTYWDNGNERVADLPEEVLPHFHDLGDRKIVAAAWLGNAPIVNAADSDWSGPKESAGLKHLGVTVIQLLTDEERAACKTREKTP